MRRDKLINGEYYHIFNRGVERRNIFSDEIDFRRFVESLKDFNTTDPAWKVEWAKEKGEILKGDALVEIVAYCLNSNHFHLLLRQVQEKGIADFMQKLGTGYTMYFNKRFERIGSLFQGRFKSVHISTNEQLLYVSAYINCNCEVHGIKSAEKYKWSSFSEYLLNRKTFCKKDIITDQFKNSEDYKDFTKETISHIKEIREIKNLITE